MVKEILMRQQNDHIHTLLFTLVTRMVTENIPLVSEILRLYEKSNAFAKRFAQKSLSLSVTILYRTGDYTQKIMSLKELANLETISCFPMPLFPTKEFNHKK